mmetsp:Transcript_18233/g.29666  ORF Transcript_18233/g.29666 Transcript_18233/m.29666 type:complete len:560 (+) Transcript_18233:318-1997(+)|eukprot:CAMPEP_0203782182 /NCGR_PEP_ID=MMETSP0099_2-20121227/10825_1 /ASSEMBLY_ACC=CAM_ASM_000209 /TAXON_ID=96639 /ORGANISM=" , Strain NY0313808BC1" /LENGTH=559 /DNA_ID=CAMNT_0050683603 /DNA_START=284 /DNA_END=1963 /DNA_ORIENTATION=+
MAEISENWLCPILQTLMSDPVVASDGHTYERAAIEEWIRTCTDLDVTSPMTGLVLPSRMLFANHALRRTIMDYVQEHPDASKYMTTKEDISTIVGKRRDGGEEELLIDFRSDAEIARDKLEKERAEGVKAAELQQSSMGNENKILDTSLSPPSSVLLGRQAAHHSQADSFNKFEAGQDGRMQSRAQSKLPLSDSLSCCDILKIPASDSRLPAKDFIFSGGSDGSVRVWDVLKQNSQDCFPNIKTNREFASAHDDGIKAITTWCGKSGVGPYVVTGSRDYSIKVWDAETIQPKSDNTWNFKCKDVLEKHTDFVECLDVESTSGWLLSGGADWKACLWDLTRPDVGCMREYERHSYAIRCCSWSTSGELAVNGYQNAQSSLSRPVFATGGDDETVYVEDPRIGYSLNVAKLNTGGAVLCCCWGPMEQAAGALPWFAAGGGVANDSFNATSDRLNGWIRVWDPRMWKPIGDCSTYTTRSAQLRRRSSAEGDSDKSRFAHESMVSAITPVRTLDGSIAIASVGGDTLLNIWKLPVGPGGVASPTLAESTDTKNTQDHSSLRVI